MQTRTIRRIFVYDRITLYLSKEKNIMSLIMSPIMSLYRVCSSLAVLSLGVASSVLVGCKASITTPAPGPSTPPVVTEKAFNGQWTTGCIESGWNGYKVVDVMIQGEDFSYDSQTFVDSICSQKDSADPLQYAGKYQIIGDFGGGVLAAQLTMTQNQVSKSLNFNAAAKKNALKISEFYNSQPSVILHPPNLMLRKKTVAKPQNPDSDEALLSGFYSPSTGYQGCDQVISTQSMNDVLQMVYVDFQSPCNGQAQLSCSENICGAEGYSLTVLSSTTYSFTSDGRTSIFTKQ
jgi:hypothetical protein